jgi:glycosyltransferase involved in cell wall biosynthesis
MVADKFIWMSDGLQANHKAKGLSKRSDAKEVTIPVPLPRFPLILTETAELDYLFKKPALAFFGTLNPQFDLSILKSHIDCSPSSYEFNYIIAGSGEKLTFLKKIFSGYDNVFFLGQIPFEKTQIISRRCSGFFLYYREPETYANHITNKFREYAEHRKPIFHNLISSNFTIGEKAYKIGCSCHEFSFEEALVAIKTTTFSQIFAIESLERLANDLSWNTLERQFISTLED